MPVKKSPNPLIQFRSRILTTIFFGLFSTIVSAEIVKLSCVDKKYGPYNLTIATPPSVKSPMVLFNDKEGENFGSYIRWNDDIYIGTSEIKFATNMKDADTGRLTRVSYSISRVSGKLVIIGLNNGELASMDSEQCESRRANKF